MDKAWTLAAGAALHVQYIQPYFAAKT